MIDDYTIMSILDRNIQRCKNKIAIYNADTLKSITYGALHTQSNKIASFLQTQDCKYVAIVADNDENYISVLLACAISGKVAIPVTASDSKALENIVSMVNDYIVINCHQIINNNLIDKHRTFDIDDIISKIVNENVIVTHKNCPIFCILTTSGTTGKPKGVKISQNAIITRVYATKYVQVSESDTVLFHTAIGFDASLFEIFIALLNSASLVCTTNKTQLDHRKYSQIVKQHGVTVLFQTTSVFHKHVANSNMAQYQSLQYLIVGGEPMKAEFAKKLMKSNASPRILVNGYGPTEATIFSTCYIMNKGDGIANKYSHVPIGNPIDSTIVKLIDKDLNEISGLNMCGEIVIGGPGVASGYLNDSDNQLNTFKEMVFRDVGLSCFYRTGDIAYLDENNHLIYQGRYDKQVKLSGHRFSLEQVEAVLDSYESIKNSAVIHDQELSILIGFIVKEESVSFSEEAIRNYLQEKLPTYMLPKKYILVDDIPLTINGKLDRTELHMLYSDEQPKLNRPIEEEVDTLDYICLLTEEISMQEDIDIDASFSQLGIISLELIDLSEKISKRFGVAFNVIDMYQYNTPLKVSEYIDSLLSAANHKESIHDTI